MIQVTYIHSPNRYSLSITGHSGYAKEGEDIVCAAVSTLVCSLDYALKNIPIQFIMVSSSLESGSGIIECEPKNSRIHGKISILYGFVLDSLCLIAKGYPDHVSVKGWEV